MSIFCVISPDPRALLKRLGIEARDGNRRWQMFHCDIHTVSGLMDAQEWLLDTKPLYVLVELKDFDEESCKNEQTLSNFLEQQSIPAQFLLPKVQQWHNVMTVAMSAKLGIHDLTLDRLEGQELINSIEGHITVYHMPQVQRNSTAH